MHRASLAASAAAVSPEACKARAAGKAELAEALVASRRDTLSTFAAYRQALPDLRVPRRDDVNPPLWELGHIGWFQEFWIGRFSQREDGHRANPDAARSAPFRQQADSLYDSSRVAHDARWTLPLPDVAATQADLAAQLAQTLALLGTADDSDDALYFFRLALLHEDMHHEAALYMAQSLDIEIADARWQCPLLVSPPATLDCAGGAWSMGEHADAGSFRFDNELGRVYVDLAPFCIDAQVCRWAEYLPAVEAGAVPLPRYLRCEAGRWLQRRHGRWQALDLHAPTQHIGRAEAEAWCRWAGRRLPTEAEWDHAAAAHPEAFEWGVVWEWTASPFAPFPGFQPHPYRDYSAPWFDGRPVLRGASYMTQPRMRHGRYRNFFKADRSDVAVGFRTCANT